MKVVRFTGKGNNRSSRFANTNVHKSTYNELSATTFNSTKNFMNTVVQENQTGGAVSQKIEIIAGKINCENLVISQSAKVSISAMSKMSSQQIADLTNKINRDLETDLSRILNQKNSGLRSANRIFNKNVSEDVSNITKIMNTNLESTIENTVKNTMRTSGAGKQEIKLVVGSIEGKNCTISQDMSLDLVSSACTDSTMDIMENNEEITSILNKYESEVDQENEMFDFEGLAMIVIAGIVFLVVIVILVMAVKSMSGGKKEGSKSSTSSTSPPSYSEATTVAFKSRRRR